MKKARQILYTLAAVIGVILTPMNVQAQIGGGIAPPSLFRLNGTAILPQNTSWELGSSGTRIAKGWFTSLDVGTFLVTSLSSSGCISAGGAATSTICGDGTSTNLITGPTRFSGAVLASSTLTAAGRISSEAGGQFGTVTSSYRMVFTSSTPVVSSTYSIGLDNGAAGPGTTSTLNFNAPTGTGMIFGFDNTMVKGITSAGEFIARSKNFRLLNTQDTSVVTEALYMDWSANVARIYTFPTGGATARNLNISALNSSAGGGTVSLSANTPYVSLSHSSTAVAGSMIGASGTNTASSGTTTFFYLAPSINQSGTAAFNTFLINPSVSTLGTGQKNLAIFQVSGSDVFRFGLAGDFTQTQIANTSAAIAPRLMTLTGAAHTNGTASAEWNDILIDLSATKTWSGGSTIDNQRDIAIKPRTYAATGTPFTMQSAATLSLDGGPGRSSSVNIQNSTALELRTWSSNNSSGATQIAIYMPGLGSNVTSTNSLAGLVVDAAGSNPVTLGAQTATTTVIAGLAVVPITYQSATNTRTIGTLAAAAYYAPIVGSNLNVLAGPYSQYLSGNALIENGFWLNKLGSSTSTIKIGSGTVFVTSTGVGNVGAGEDPLIATTLPAGALANNGDSLELQAEGTFAASANNKRLRAYFGTTAIFDSGTLPLVDATEWTMRCTVIRKTATTQRANCLFNSSSSTFGSFADVSGPSETLANALTVGLTGEATDNDDVRNESLLVKFNAN